MVLDRHVLSLDVAGFAEALAKLGAKGRRGGRGAGADKTNCRYRRLLRPRRQRPRRAAAEQRDDFAPPHHSITSSARSTRPVGTSWPIALAVRRLMTSSKTVGCSTGMSAGFAPRNILTIIRARCR